MQTVYFNYTMMPEEFKKRNQRHIDNYDPLCFHDYSKKPEGSPVKKGEDILLFSFYPSEDTFAIKSPIDGYIHYDVDVLALSGGSHFKKVKICDIYDDFNDLVRAHYNNEYEFTIDEFTNEEVFCWTKVAGKESIGFHICTYIVSFLIIDKTPYLAFGDVSKPDRLVFLFCDKSLIDYDLHSCKRINNFLTLIPLYREDLQKFKEIQLYKFRVFHSETPETVGFERPIDVILFQLYSKHFVSILEDVGIDWRSFDQYEDIRTNINCECYVYLMHDVANGFYKIGISNRPEYRERTLQSEKPTIELICAKRFPSRIIAEAIESALHKAFSEKRLRGEWFSLTSAEVEQLKATLS